MADTSPPEVETAPAGAGGRLAATWAGARAVVGALMGLAPHVLHHVGFLAGAALLTGALGNTVLYAVGMLLSIPMLRRLGRRFGTWRAPAIGVVVFTGLFALSVLVIGPLFDPGATPAAPGGVPSPSSSTGAGEHDAHHG